METGFLCRIHRDSLRPTTLMNSQDLRILLGLVNGDEAFDIELGPRGEAAWAELMQFVDVELERSSDPEALKAEMLAVLDDYLRRQAETN